MNIRFGILISSFASLSVGAAMGACSSSSASSTTGSDAGHTATDSGTPHDATQAGDSSTPRDAAPSSDAGTPGDAGAPGDAEVAACLGTATAGCGLAAQCNANGFSGSYGDASTCVARSVKSCQNNFGSPNTGSNVAHSTACASAEMGESCTNYLNGETPDACAVPVGTGAAGSGCSFNAQCASGFCALPLTSACGTCAPQPTVGASCAHLASCGPGLVCDKEVCQTYQTAVSGPCSATQPCGAGLSCVIAKDAGAGTCQTAGATVGAACDSKLETAPGCYAQLGLFCEPTTSTTNPNTCQKVTPATAGQACGFLDGVNDNCTEGSNCFKVGDAGKQCVARAADNATCNTLTGPACTPPSRCVGTILDGGTSGTCVFPGATACP